MKTCIVYFLLFLSFFSLAQYNYARQNISLISFINPNFGEPGIDNRYYSGCWGWYQQAKNKEYAISGTSNGAYFIDVTNPATPTVCAFVAGKPNCTWREVKTYQHYCYIISDDPKPNKFQIVDMQYLPDSVHLVYQGTDIFEHAHTLWIDQDKMYVGLVTYTTGFSPMNVYSLATPTAPVLLREIKQDISASIITEVHDMYARNDTVYASCGWNGLYVLKYNTATNNFTQLGNYSGYTSSAYNHSSSLTQNGKYLLFCDEVPASKPVHYVDVQNLNNIQPLQTFKPYPLTTPHNPYVMGNNFAVIACYEDGLYIYNISEPGNAQVVGFFDTHPQGGGNVGNYVNDDYSGNWGAYPYLPSGIIIAQDMQNGVFILDGTEAFNSPLGIKDNAPIGSAISVYPDPASSEMFIHVQLANGCDLQLKNMLGQTVYEKHLETLANEQINVQDLPNGAYVISIKDDTQSFHKKIVIRH